MQKYLLTALLMGLFFSAQAQKKIDVVQYAYVIELNDRNDTISQRALIKFAVNDSTSSVTFDLAKEMQVTEAGFLTNPTMLDFRQTGDKISIHSPRLLYKGDTTIVAILYKGVPADGLIISKNKFGKRTFFSDNWPNRAHKWLACIDDPADKAAVEFVVMAPSHYKVVSNGVLVKEYDLSNNTKMTQWKEDVPLPTKIMVIGVADFAVDSVGEANGVPVSTWVFEQNKKEGFYDYAPAKEILSFLSNYIGPFPYKKLANVQSKTIFGGMENAGAIFYHENSVTGKRNIESLLAHEIAHQWFGDMATEKSFAHLWLSEGFATYLAHIYIESKYGTDSLNGEMKKDRREVIDFMKETNHPVVDSTSDYMSLLNANSYQKGAWILHMLRRQLGDSIFRECIRAYYKTYAGKNADSDDLENVFEKASGKDLSAFFYQWLHKPGVPKLDIRWEYFPNRKEVIVLVKQKEAFGDFPLELKLQTESGKTIIQKVRVVKRNEKFNFPVNEKITGLIADPNTSLLFEGAVTHDETILAQISGGF